MRIGIDFDNTLIDYDAVFVAAARERGLVGAGFVGTKRDVRDAIRLLPEGELEWQRLQGYVYGGGIGGARLFDGVREFLGLCRQRRAAVCIVSHKTRFGHYDPHRIDLRQAARFWLADNGLLRPGPGDIPPDQVFFAETRAAKLAQIAALDCTCYIDDLEEVFADPEFPAGVTRILFAADPSRNCDRHCRDWADIAAAVFDDL